MMATEAVLRGGEGAWDRTDRDGPETPAFPVHKETDEWEGVGSSWRIPQGQSPFLQACPRVPKGTPSLSTRTFEIFHPAFQQIF